jgi:hypothetical protein
MLLNRLPRRRGHFWERRYHAVAVPDRDTGGALRVLRYIHANPKAAGMIAGNAWAYSNYRSSTRPADDGLMPGIRRTGGLPRRLDGCARRYEQFCRRYRPQAKEQQRSRWGGWQLWREIDGGAAQAGGQADLFDVPGARYRGGRDGHDGRSRWPSAARRPGRGRTVCACKPALRWRSGVVHIISGGLFTDPSSGQDTDRRPIFY